jgi:hypothetical protein
VGIVVGGGILGSFFFFFAHVAGFTFFRARARLLSLSLFAVVVVVVVVVLLLPLFALRTTHASQVCFVRGWLRNTLLAQSCSHLFFFFVASFCDCPFYSSSSSSSSFSFFFLLHYLLVSDGHASTHFS